jgi:hypothetical protein
MKTKSTPLGPLTRTERHFEIVLFQDRYKTPCSLQQSSLAESEQPGSSAVWLGVDQARMHLDLGQVQALIAVLENWVASGSFDGNAQKFIDYKGKI